VKESLGRTFFCRWRDFNFLSHPLRYIRANGLGSYLFGFS
jgi:hypothetical protein